MDPVYQSSEVAGTSGTSGTSEIKRQGKRAKLSGYLSHGWAKGKERSKEEVIKGWEKGRLMAETEFIKGKTGLENSLGLGATPNVIPPGEARVDGKLRTVEIGWHPMAVMGGKWLAEQSGKIVAKNIGEYPDPTQHWAVLVGGYIHQLWMDEKLCIIYNNEKLDRPRWQTFEVGKTRFTDEAVRQAATMTIYQMRMERPLYNLVTNNCQDFAIRLLDAIQVGAHAQFVTSFAIYQAATGDGTIKDLFADAYPKEQAKDPAKTGIQRTDTIAKAQKVMDENTTKLDNHKTKRFPLFSSKGGSA